MPKVTKSKKKNNSDKSNSIVSKIKQRKKQNTGKNYKKFSYYPIINEDDDFEEKLFKKKEFYIYKQKDKSNKSYDELCNPKISKDISSLDNRNYKTLCHQIHHVFIGFPWYGACAAVQTAEGFKETITKNNGSIYILASNDAQHI